MTGKKEAEKPAAAKRKKHLPDIFNNKIFLIIIIAAFFINALAFIIGFLFDNPLLTGIISFVLSVITATIAAVLQRRLYNEADHLRKTAESVSESKSNFIAVVSHEIRTPMNSIIGFSELAMEGESSLKTKDFLNKINTNAKWLLQIVNDILDISKVESGRMEIENIPFDMHDLLSSCRTLIMPSAVEKGLVLYFYVEPSLGKRPLGDPKRLRQVLVNLLSNAVKFTNTGMIKLNASLKNMSDESITMYFEVKDSGIGMTNDQIDKIFDPYMLAQTGINRKFSGTGLGLSITKNIIESMGGKLSVESNPGIGSKFYFELVFDTININDDESADNKISFNELEKPAFSGEILLCEDNQMNQQVISEHLKRVGLVTVTADNGKIGYEMVKKRMENGEKQFDLVFMDMHMPVMDGLEASLKIRELKTGVPVVAMTANVMFNDREIYKNSGMHDCVGKPFTSQELWRCLMKYLTPLNQGSDEYDKNAGLEANLEFHKELQRLFIENNRNKYIEVTEALESGDIELACRLIHSLKANAGQAGKIILQSAAADVEFMLKNGKNYVTEDQLKILKTELDIVLNEFSSDI
ncbi:MAG: response regulator [Treponema sp.]|jgi:signal transduction histidine kinase/DNA-binding response OmpR family regulator|nr:response regulator [Treponema sp.]